MKLDLRLAALLLPLLVASCAHKTQQAQSQPPLAPPIEDAPLPPPNKAPANLPPPVETTPQPPQPATANTQPTTPPKPAPKHKKPAQPATTGQTTQQTTQQASNDSAPKVSADGQFSPGEAGDQRKQTSDSIAATEKGLSGITRPLNDQDQKTSAQIREFLKQAKVALDKDDVDGAHTLALKAKVLLDELTQ
jgi:outer membrane biosynthesis protein TonB